MTALDVDARAHLHRVVRWCAAGAAATVVLTVVTGVLVQRAHARAEHLATRGVAADGQVVDRYARGKGTYVLVEFSDGTGSLRRVEVDTRGTFFDPYSDYPEGQPVAVRYRADDPEDLRTATDWNTPGRLEGSAAVTGALASAGAVLVGVLGAFTRSLRRRLTAGRWERVQPVVEGSGQDRRVAVPVPDARAGVVQLDAWPVPPLVDVLIEPAPRRSVVLRLPGPPPRLTTVGRERK